MERRRIGTSDLEVAVMGLGGNTFGPPRLDAEASTRNIHRALELGVNFIDTAVIYGQGNSESFIGEAIKGRRDNVILATKYHLRDLEGKSVAERTIEHCDKSLAALQTDHIDLFQLHFPVAEIPAEEVLRPLGDLVKAGKIRYIGVSNYSSWRHAQTVQIARTQGLPEMVSMQNHYNLLRRHAEVEVLPYCAANDVGFVPYFPLAGGVLTGKYHPGEPPPPGSRGAAGSPVVERSRTPENEEIAEALRTYAGERGHSLLDLAMGWLLAHPQVSTVITGTSTPEQVESNVAATEWKLTPEEKADIDAIAAWDGSAEGMEAAGVGSAPGSLRTGR
jgi:aryl-alcohol dehydrogenase-like predicted oxidoreductase